MNNMRNLIKYWEANSHSKSATKEMNVSLTIRDLARICALADIYSGRTKEQIVSDLVAAALDEIEEAFPYVQGSKVIAEDEFGEPVYEDIGVTPKFEVLTMKHLSMLK